MNKKFNAKKIITLSIAGAVMFFLTGCGNNSTNNDSDQETGKVTLDSNDNQAVSEQDMDDDNDMNTPNMVTVEYPDEGKAKITNEDDTVGIVENKDGVISSTSYIYKNQKIDSVIMTMEFKSNDEAKKEYEELKDDKEIYSSVELQENKIVCKANENYVKEYSEKTQDELYNELKEIYKDMLQD